MLTMTQRRQVQWGLLQVVLVSVESGVNPDMPVSTTMPMPMPLLLLLLLLLRHFGKHTSRHRVSLMMTMVTYADVSSFRHCHSVMMQSVGNMAHTLVYLVASASVILLIHQSERLNHPLMKQQQHLHHHHPQVGSTLAPSCCPRWAQQVREVHQQVHAPSCLALLLPPPRVVCLGAHSAVAAPYRVPSAPWVQPLLDSLMVVVVVMVSMMIASPCAVPWVMHNINASNCKPLYLLYLDMPCCC